MTIPTEPGRSFRLSRRHLLKACGVGLSLPLLDAMVPSAMAGRNDSEFEPWSTTQNVRPRMICCYVPNGVNIQQWMPDGQGRGYPLSPTLQTLKPFADDFSVLTGLGHPDAQGGHSGADTWLTGADLTSKPGSDYANVQSIDQVVAAHHGQQTRFASLQLSDMSGTGSAGHSHTLSFDRSGTPLPAENSPRRLFERLFVPDRARDRAATLQRYAEKKSVLDLVLDQSRNLRARLGPSDQQKLEEYLNSVRETERRVERLEQWVDVPKPEVRPDHLQLNMQPNNAHDRPMWLDVMLELSYLALVTDTTRVITFEWSREAGGFGGGGENHHELSHHGGDPGMLEKLARIDQFHLQRLGRFLDLLKRTVDGDGPMLEQTMVLYGSGMNSGMGGEHSPRNLPTLICGGQRLGLKQGQHLAHDPQNHPPLNSVLLTMAQAMGVEIPEFGRATSRLTGLI